VKSVTIARTDIEHSTNRIHSSYFNGITYELLGLVIERSSNIVSLFKVLENIRIDA
jgi:hypothetical protein